MGPELIFLLVVLVVVVVWRGPNTLPRLGEALGRTVKGVRDNVPGAVKGESGESTDDADRPGSSES